MSAESPIPAGALEVQTVEQALAVAFKKLATPQTYEQTRAALAAGAETVELVIVVEPRPSDGYVLKTKVRVMSDNRKLFHFTALK